VTRLAGLLERRKVDCVLVDGDSAHDHCVLRLSSIAPPRVHALLEYENHGVEPRFVGLLSRHDESVPRKEEYPLEWQKTLQLSGARAEDPDKIAQWIDRELLNGAS
jgi:hypothetical protein